MQAYIIRRLLAMVPTLLFASLIVFTTVRLIPDNIIDLMLSSNDIGADKKNRAQLETMLGLDQTIVSQYFKRLGAILFGGSLAKSLWQNTSVMQEVLHRLPTTFELGIIALIVALLVGIPIGVYSAVAQDTLSDYLTRSFAILALVLPGFWVGTLVMVFPLIWWGWSPEVKYIPFTQDALRNLAQMTIPALILGMAFSAVVMRLTRTMMLEVMRLDYIRTAVGKEAGEPHDYPAPCAAQRADPRDDPGRPAGAGAGGRHGDHGADLRHPRHGPAAARGGEPARLSHHHRRVPDRGRSRGPDQPDRRPQLRAA